MDTKEDKEGWTRKVTMIRSYDDEECIAYLVNIKSIFKLEYFDKLKREYSYDFEIEGMKWSFKLYPFGQQQNDEGYVSFYMHLDYTSAVVVNITRLDEDVVYTHKINPNDGGWGIPKWRKWSGKQLEMNYVLQYMHSQNSKSNKIPNSIICYPWVTYDLSHKLFSKIADFELKGSDWSCFAHKDVLSTVSSVFEAMLSNKMKESIENCVEIEDVSNGKIIEEMLHFIYTGRMHYNDEEILCGICKLTHRYSMNMFNLACDHQLSLYITTENVSDKMVLAVLFDLRLCKKRCSDFISKNYKSVVETEAWKRLVRNPDCTLYITKFLAGILKM